MATSIIHGFNGTVSWASDATANTYVTAWSLSISVDVVDATSLNDFAAVGTSYKNYVPGFKDWEATIDVNLHKADPTKIGIAEASLALSDGTTTYTGNGVASLVSQSMSIDDVYKCTFTVKGSGALS